jgi:hypoxanthine phosphoribosyltransferase
MAARLVRSLFGVSKVGGSGVLPVSLSLARCAPTPFVTRPVVRALHTSPILRAADAKTSAGAVAGGLRMANGSPVPVEWSSKISKVLFTAPAISSRVHELAREISGHYAGRVSAERPLLVAGVLNGAALFTADLVRALSVPAQMDFIAVSSYGSGATTSGTHTLSKDFKIRTDTQRETCACSLEHCLTPRPLPPHPVHCAAIAGRHVLVVEDILDTGLTLSWLLSHLSRAGTGTPPASVEMAALLDKTERRAATTKGLRARFTGFQCPDEFVVGYGLDFAENYRTLPAIVALKP